MQIRATNACRPNLNENIIRAGDGALLRLREIPIMLFTTTMPIDDRMPRNRFLIHQRNGLHPIEILNALSAIADGLKPRYYTPVDENQCPPQYKLTEPGSGTY